MKTKSNKKAVTKKLVLSFVFVSMLLLSLATVCTNLIPSHSAPTLICERPSSNDSIDIRRKRG